MNTMDPATRAVRSIPGGYFLLREAAEMLGVSTQKIRKLIKTPELGLTPKMQTHQGKSTIYLYTQDDVDRIRQYLVEQSTPVPFTGEQMAGGRPRRFSDDQRKVRARLKTKRYYWQGKLDEAKKAKDKEAIAKANEVLADINDQLEQM
jgi:transposase